MTNDDNKRIVKSNDSCWKALAVKSSLGSMSGASLPILTLKSLFDCLNVLNPGGLGAN